jgi:hypothetical protein
MLIKNHYKQLVRVSSWDFMGFYGTHGNYTRTWDSQPFDALNTKTVKAGHLMPIKTIKFILEIGN